MKIILSITLAITLLLPVGMLDYEKERNDIKIDFSDPEIELNEEHIYNLGLRGDFFTENIGQKSKGAGFYYAQGYPLSVGFGQGWAAYKLINQDNTSNIGGVLFRTYFVNCNLVEPVGVDPLIHKNNYFIGNNPDKWVTGVSNYREVWYYDIWDGIDLKYYFKDGMLKYDFIIHPGADPELIEFEYNGIESLELKFNNDLMIKTTVGSVSDKAPIAFQNEMSDLDLIDCSFKILGISSLTFELEQYDNENTLIIDPGLNFSTYLGGSRDDFSYWNHANLYEVDDFGNTYIGGSQIYSDDYPTTVGAFNRTNSSGCTAAISKMNSNGTALIYSTYIESSGRDQLQSIRVNKTGYVIGAGNGAGADFPVTNGAFQTIKPEMDGFIFKLNRNGSKLIFGSFIGGSGEGFIGDVGISNDGSYIVTGTTSSTDFPGVSNGYDSSYNGGNRDVFVMRINQNGSKITHASYFGGSGFERPFRIGFDSNDNVIIAGGSGSNDLPMDINSYQRNLIGSHDGFLVKFNYNITKLLNSTYIGGSFPYGGEDDRVICIRIGPQNKIYACGWTASSDFPTTNGAYDTTYNDGGGDYYYIIMDENLSKLDYGTFFGGTGKEGNSYFGYCGIDITNCLDVVLAGTTNSIDIPTTYDCFRSSPIGGWDIFIARFDMTGDLKYCTYFGGSGGDFHDNTVHHNQLYTTISGCTYSMDLPTTSGAFDGTHNGDGDFFITRLWTGEDYFHPKEVYEVKVYSDPLFNNPINSVNVTDEVYIELKGLDGSELNQDFTLVKIKSSKSDPIGFRLYLKETGLNTGIYQNTLNISSRSDPLLNMIKASIKETITITSFIDPSVYEIIKVKSQVLIYPFEDIVHTEEDSIYHINYTNVGFNSVSKWRFDTDADWLNWDAEEHSISGQPDNGDVGLCWVRLNITDGLGHYDEHHFNIEVENTPPILFTENVITVNQSDYYYVDYDCDDEGQGITRWHIDTLATWLRFDAVTGILNGTPTQNYVGSYEINISVDDGNGGLNWTTFSLNVVDINDNPIITTLPTQSVFQNDPYYVDFMAVDPDGDIVSEWHLNSNVKFLSMDIITGELSGTPENDDVGIYFINVTGTDPGGLSDFINYTLEVIDINDDPSWANIPLDSNVDQGEIFSFQVEASDVDIGDKVTYRIETNPDIGIEIDTNIGLIEWNATIEGITPNPDYIIQVTVYASDDDVEISHWFSLKVIPNPSPISKLLSPDDDELVPSTGIYLEWEGEDDSINLKYNLYFSKSYNSILEFKKETLVFCDINVTRIRMYDLTPGSIYYWTVIPKDQFSIGSCQENIYSFRVNTLPRIDEINNQTVNVGDEISISISGSDPETKSDDLVFSLISAPDGMDIFGNQIFWTPGIGDVGTHIIDISLFDGLEYNNTSFEITVTSGEIDPEDNGGGFPIWILIVILMIMILLIGGGIGAYVFVKKKELSEHEEETPDEETVLTEKGKQAFEQLFGPP